jgi:SPP1 gp7 family putative phage head morphogenesis protein
MDYGHRESDRRLAELERRIDREYRQAYTEIKAKADEFFEKFRDEDKKLSQKVKQGEMSKENYIKWRRANMLNGNALINLEKNLVNDLVNADRIAGQMISEHKVDIYALNRNYGEYEIENALNIDLGFSLYDHKSVEKLIKDQSALLPTQLDEARDLKWNRQKVSSAITQGILQGESIPNIGKRLRKVVGMDKTASIRNARTATTGAENAGRVDSYKDAEKKGVELEKKWIATLDQRTRSEHRQLDGQTRPIHDKFKVDGEEIGYPGDPTAAGYLVYNCRCTIVAEVEGIKYKDVRRSRLPKEMSYETWQKAKPRKR